MGSSDDEEEVMATTLQLPAIQPFSVTSDQTTLGQRWSKWVKGLEYFLVASNITEKKSVLYCCIWLVLKFKPFSKLSATLGRITILHWLSVLNILSQRTFHLSDTLFGWQRKSHMKALTRMLLSYGALRNSVSTTRLMK